MIHRLTIIYPNINHRLSIDEPTSDVSLVPYLQQKLRDFQKNNSNCLVRATVKAQFTLSSAPWQLGCLGFWRPPSDLRKGSWPSGIRRISWGTWTCSLIFRYFWPRKYGLFNQKELDFFCWIRTCNFWEINFCFTIQKLSTNKCFTIWIFMGWHCLPSDYYYWDNSPTNHHNPPSVTVRSRQVSLLQKYPIPRNMNPKPSGVETNWLGIWQITWQHFGVTYWNAPWSFSHGE